MFSFFHPFSLADVGSVTCELNVELIAPQSEGGSQPGPPERTKIGKMFTFCRSLQDFKLFIIGEFLRSLCSNNFDMCRLTTIKSFPAVIYKILGIGPFSAHFIMLSRL